MNDTVVKVEGLGKRYRIPKVRASNENSIGSRVKIIKHKCSAFMRGDFSEVLRDSADFWALKDISFEVKRGEAVGIIGRNGAGKSTLLKILSRITEPTEGEAEIRGRVGSLLQVGAGFNHELTGRENIFLNGVILGMTSAAIRARFEEIVEFSEVGKFLDMPLKHYSSGMRVRLGFSIAINLDPEILMLDEVFAVGDAMFRQKCIERLSNEVLRGRTVLFVSHSMEQVKRLVNRCIVIEEGKVSFIGDPEIGVEKYLKMAALQQKVLSFSYQPGNVAQIDRCYLMDENREPAEVLPFTRPMRVRVEFSVLKQDDDLRLGVVVAFCNEDGDFLTLLSTDDLQGVPDFKRVGRYYFDVTLPGALFNPNTIVIRPAISANGKAVHNHPRFGQGISITLIDPEADLMQRVKHGKRSALLVLRPQGECGYLDGQVIGPELGATLI